MDPIQRFDPESENFALVKQLLKAQGKDTCQDKIDVDWLTSSLLSLSFGFVYATEKAKIGKRSLNSPNDKYHVQGFVTCRSIKENPRIIWIDLICSRIRSKVGKLLMEAAEAACKKIPGVLFINLYSLPEVKLRNWYKKLGYIENAVPTYQGGKPKAYLMTKFI